MEVENPADAEDRGIRLADCPDPGRAAIRDEAVRLRP